MSTVLYVIDLRFTELFAAELEKEERSSAYEAVTTRQLGEFYVIARPDGLDDEHQVSWDECVPPLLEHVKSLHPSRLIVLAHKGVLSGYIRKEDQYKVETRVPAAEEQLRGALTNPTPSISVYGFHHERKVGEIWELLRQPRQLAVPGTLARLRSIVDEGGGPLGRLSALKHELMRPFASVRLRLQINGERGSRHLDPESIDRIVAAVHNGRKTLAEIRTAFEVTRNFDKALTKARGLLDEDPRAITADPDHFNGWIDRLNDALDAVRKEAR